MRPRLSRAARCSSTAAGRPSRGAMLAPRAGPARCSRCHDHQSLSNVCPRQTTSPSTSGGTTRSGRSLKRCSEAHGVRRYAIFLDEVTADLFAYAEIESEERWQAIAGTDVCQRWWQSMKPLMPSHGATAARRPPRCAAALQGYSQRLVSRVRRLAGPLREATTRAAQTWPPTDTRILPTAAGASAHCPSMAGAASSSTR